MGLILNYFDGQTPLDEDEKNGLLIPTISTRGELDEFEQQNIEEAVQWTLSRNFKQEEIFSEKFLLNLHQRMFGNVWKWAGEYRKTNKNLGVDKWQIPIELSKLLADTRFWIANETFTSDEIALHFKHRIVSIHCFSNGNGRHSRLMADIIIEKVFNKPVFSWGADNLSNEGSARDEYLKAIKAADIGVFNLLIKFARE